jgi:phosphoserine phosphatase RsbU-like protein
MSAPPVLFSRRYRAALLDYLLGSGETGLARAYDLGRTAIDEGIGLLKILRAHQKAVNGVLESTPNISESLKRLKAAEDFLMETLSPFEMTYRGYVALLEDQHEKPCEERVSTWNGTERRRGKDRRVASRND